MLIFGLLLVLLAAAVITYMVLATAGESAIPLDYGILNVEMQPLWLFLAGAATVAVAAIGLWLMAVGARSKARRAKEMRELRKQAKDQDRRIERSGDATAPRTGRTTTSGHDSPQRPATIPGPASNSRPGDSTYGTGTSTDRDVPQADRSRLDLDR